MENIDLTKCNNLRYKAKIDGNEDYGRICVENADTGLAFLRSGREDGYIAAWHCDGPGVEGCSGRKVTDFEIVPRDPETYKDWQVGDRVCDNKHRNASHEVIFRSGELVVMKTDANTACSNYTCDELFGCGYRLILTDIEKQIIEEKKKYEPQDGDVCYAENRNGYCTPFIYRHTGLNRTAFYAAFDKWGNVLMYHGNAISKETLKMLRPATDEEKQRLFDAMAKEGKRWNAEKKVVEDIPKSYEFKKGEPVLVRDDNESIWILGSFIQFIPTNCFHVTNGVRPSHWKQCIPYNEKTMHLLGTTEDYKEE